MHTQAQTKNREMWSQLPSQMGWRLPQMGAGRNPSAGAVGSTTGSPRRAAEGQTTSVQDSWDPGPAEQQVGAAYVAVVTHRTFSPDLSFGSAAAGWGRGGLPCCRSSLHVSIVGRKGFWWQSSDACNGERLLGAVLPRGERTPHAGQDCSHVCQGNPKSLCP